MNTTAQSTRNPSEAERKLLNSVKKIVPNAEQITIAIDDIFVDKEDNARDLNSEAYSAEKIESLAGNIESTGGLLQAIGVMEIEPTEQNGQKNLALVWGYRRYFALQYLQEQDKAEWSHTKAIKVAPANMTELKMVQVAENLNRVDLSAIEKARTVRDLMQGDAPLSQQEAGRALGMSEGATSQHLKLLNLPGNVQDQITTGQITFSAARVLVDKVPAAHWAEAAVSAATLSLAAFEERVAKNYGGTVDGAAPGTTTTSAGTKVKQILRATEIEGRFIPFVKERLGAADKTKKEFTAADLEAARLDTLQSVMLVEGAKLTTDIKPYMESKDKEEEADKAKKEQDKQLDAFLRHCVREAEDLVRAPIVDATKANPTPAEAFAIIAAKVKEYKEADFKEAKVDQTLIKVNDPNFKKEFITAMIEKHGVIVKDRAENAAKAAKKKAEKEAAEKKEADAKASNPVAAPAAEAAK